MLALYQVAKAMGTPFIAEVVEEIWQRKKSQLEEEGDAALGVLSIWGPDEFVRLWASTKEGDLGRNMFIDVLARGGRAIVPAVDKNGAEKYPSEMLWEVQKKIFEIEEAGPQLEQTTPPVERPYREEIEDLEGCIHSPVDKWVPYERHMSRALDGCPESEESEERGCVTLQDRAEKAVDR